MVLSKNRPLDVSGAANCNMRIVVTEAQNYTTLRVQTINILFFGP